MATNEAPTPVDLSVKSAPLDPVAAVLSYLVPGMGQVYQGRILKGILFLFCLWGLFFYGLFLGNWQNVYFPPRNVPNHGDIILRAPVITQLLGGRPFVIPHAPYLAQFCVGVAAWPAVLQAASYDLNEPDRVHPLLGAFQRYPNLPQQEEMLRNGDKSGDLGWVYTIIAGLLNLLVIYDALAGPAHGTHPVQRTTFLTFLLVLTVVCAVGVVVLAFLMLARVIAPTLYLQLPIVLALVSLVYSATRFDLWRPIVLEAVHWGWRMAAFLLTIGVLLYFVARPPFLG